MTNLKQFVITIKETLNPERFKHTSLEEIDPYLLLEHIKREINELEKAMREQLPKCAQNECAIIAGFLGVLYSNIRSGRSVL